MNHTFFIRLATVTFAVVGFIHLYRGFFGLPITIGTWQGPIWVSFLESGFFLFLAYSGLRQWFIKDRG